MGTINGFAIVTRRQVGREFVILGVKSNAHSPSGFEYVTAHIDSISAHHWGQGHYTWDFSNAVQSYNTL